MHALAPITTALLLATGAHARAAPHLVPVDHAEHIDGFRAALLDLALGRRDRVRVLHLGDSNVARGSWPGRVRSLLGVAHGDAGPGLIVPRPQGLVRAAPVSVQTGGRWKHAQLRFRGPRRRSVGSYGVGGVALDGRRGAWVDVWIDAAAPLTAALHLVARPGGGLVRIRGNDIASVSISTVAPEPALLSRAWRFAPGRHLLRVQVVAGHVRLLGLRFEYERAGVVYEAVGVPGQHVEALNVLDPALLVAQLEGYAPDLVVLAYGGNEAFFRHLSLARYRRSLEAAVRRVQELLPGADLLLAGPIATWPVEPRVLGITRIQWDVARRQRAAFWDSSAVTDPTGSLFVWVRSRPRLVSRDGIHLTKLGYRHLGESFAHALDPELVSFSAPFGAGHPGAGWSTPRSDDARSRAARSGSGIATPWDARSSGMERRP